MFDLNQTAWKPVTSSNIAALAHEGSHMFVKFLNGTVYSYENVPQEIFEEILESDSIGKAFNAKVKSQSSVYPYHKLH